MRVSVTPPPYYPAARPDDRRVHIRMALRVKRLSEQAVKLRVNLPGITGEIDISDIPVGQEAEKVAELVSNQRYTRDYEYTESKTIDGEDTVDANWYVVPEGEVEVVDGTTVYKPLGPFRTKKTLTIRGKATAYNIAPDTVGLGGRIEALDVDGNVIDYGTLTIVIVNYAVTPKPKVAEVEGRYE